MDFLRLGIGLAIIIAITAAWAIINSQLKDHYQAPLKEEMVAAAALAKSKLDACATDRDTALAANLTMQADLKTLKTDIERTNALLERMKKVGGVAKAAATAAVAAEQKRLSGIDANNYDLLFVLSQPDPGGSCDERLARIDGVLRGLGQQRVRDHPPTGAARPTDVITIKAPQ